MHLRDTTTSLSLVIHKLGFFGMLVCLGFLKIRCRQEKALVYPLAYMYINENEF